MYVDRHNRVFKGWILGYGACESDAELHVFEAGDGGPEGVGREPGCAFGKEAGDDEGGDKDGGWEGVLFV